MEDGNNIINDEEDPNYLIYMNNDNVINDIPGILCQNNYWGEI
jgi:hypothetical protein